MEPTSSNINNKELLVYRRINQESIAEGRRWRVDKEAESRLSLISKPTSSSSTVAFFERKYLESPKKEDLIMMLPSEVRFLVYEYLSLADLKALREGSNSSLREEIKAFIINIGTKTANTKDYYEKPTNFNEALKIVSQRPFMQALEDSNFLQHVLKNFPHVEKKSGNLIDVAQLLINDTKGFTLQQLNSIVESWSHEKSFFQPVVINSLMTYVNNVRSKNGAVDSDYDSILGTLLTQAKNTRSRPLVHYLVDQTIRYFRQLDTEAMKDDQLVNLLMTFMTFASAQLRRISNSKVKEFINDKSILHVVIDYFSDKEAACAENLIRMLIMLGADVNRLDEKGHAPLDCAIHNISLFQLLLDEKADPLMSLHHAVRQNHTDIFQRVLFNLDQVDLEALKNHINETKTQPQDKKVKKKMLQTIKEKEKKMKLEAKANRKTRKKQ